MLASTQTTPRYAEIHLNVYKPNHLLPFVNSAAVAAPPVPAPSAAVSTAEASVPAPTTPNTRQSAHIPCHNDPNLTKPEMRQPLYILGRQSSFNSASLSAASRASRTSISIRSRARSTLLCR